MMSDRTVRSTRNCFGEKIAFDPKHHNLQIASNSTLLFSLLNTNQIREQCQPVSELLT